MSIMESLPASREQLLTELQPIKVVGKVAIVAEDLLPDVAVPSEDQQLFGD